MALYLVTGGAGFVGSHVVAKLIDEGESVRVLDNLDTGNKKNISPFIKKIDFWRADITDCKAVKKAVKGVDYVLHIAAQRAVPRSVDDPLSTDRVNVQGTLNILWAAREAHVKRVVYVSSSAVYGDITDMPLKESYPPAPTSPYGVSKLAGEYYCAVFSQIYGLETVSLRYFNVFGPRQDPHSQYANVIPLFIEGALDGKPVEVHGDGLQSRDFTYIEDTVSATLLATKAPGASGKVFNVGTGKEYSILELVRVVEQITGKKIHYTHTKARAGDIRRAVADISLAESILGYKVTVGFEKGVEKTAQWFRAQSRSSLQYT